jgi:hypothetical protein
VALQDTLAAGIAANDMHAVECARVAQLADRNGARGFAVALRELGRMHRVEMLELTTALAILKAEFSVSKPEP